MVAGRASKRRLDSQMMVARPSTVRRLLALSIPVNLAAAPLVAQAPPFAEFWRVAASSLAGPAALESGGTAAFWNPATASAPSRLTVGVEVVQTSDIVGLSGILAGARQRIQSLQLGVLLGRMEVRDLVRTTTSPNSVAGSIPVYEQMAAVEFGVRTAALHVGALFTLHDARLDTLREGGATLDVGINLTPLPGLRIAGATHLFPINFSRQETTEYYSGIEYAFARAVAVGKSHAQVVARYGAAYRVSGDLEHAFGMGIGIDELVQVDAALTSESAFGQRSWRPSLGVSLQIGRYTLDIARSSGLNDVGATYRVGLDIEVLR